MRVISTHKATMDTHGGITRICVISPAAYPLLTGDKMIRSAGGAEAQLKTIGISLAERGYDVHFIVDDYGQASFERLGNISIYKVPLRYQGGSNLYLPYDWFNLLKTLKFIGASIHLLKIPLDLLLPLGLFCRLSRRKLVFVGQMDIDTDFELLFKLRNRIAILIYRAGLFFVDCAVAQNTTQLEGFKKLGIACRMIKNVLTLPGRTSQKENYILWVGNSSVRKQPDLFPRLALRFPQYKFKMILAPVSQNPDDRRFHDLESQISNFEYVGFVPFSKIEEYFQKAALFVSTSLREGFPNTFLQAWQYGTPVVSLHVDPDWIIQRFSLGRVSGTFDNMVHDIRELMDDPELREKMGNAAKQYVESNHSLSLIVSQYVDLFSRLLDKEEKGIC